MPATTQQKMLKATCSSRNANRAPIGYRVHYTGQVADPNSNATALN